MRRRTAVAVVSVVLAVAGAVVAPVAGTVAADPTPAENAQSANRPTEIASCTTITQSGKYVLGGDVRPERETDNLTTDLEPCILIQASDVVLDGRGHALVGGKDYPAPGLLVGAPRRLSNVTVRNLTATGWGGGIGVIRTDDAVVRNVSVADNLGDGVVVTASPNATVSNVTARNNGFGVYAFDSPGVAVTDATAVENEVGIGVVASSSATVRRVEASANQLYGVSLVRSANATVADGRLRANDFAGASLLATEGATLRNLTVSNTTAETVGTGASGVYLYNSTARVERSTLRNDEEWAVYAAGNSTVVGERVDLDGTTLSFEARDVALDSASEVPAVLLIERQRVGDALVANATGERARLSLSVQYRDADVAAAGAQEETLRLWRFDSGEWRPTRTDLRTGRNVASATFAELNRTVIALVGEGLAGAKSESTSSGSPDGDD